MSGRTWTTSGAAINCNVDQSEQMYARFHERGPYFFLEIRPTECKSIRNYGKSDEIII